MYTELWAKVWSVQMPPLVTGFGRLMGVIPKGIRETPARGFVFLGAVMVAQGVEAAAGQGPALPGFRVILYCSERSLRERSFFGSCLRYRYGNGTGVSSSVNVTRPGVTSTNTRCPVLNPNRSIHTPHSDR